MIKILSALFLITASLFSQNFEQFLDNAIKNSPYLQASNLNLEQAKESGDALSRYANPTLELELSNFTPYVGDSNIGYRASYSQPLRLWGVGNDKEVLSLAMTQTASSSYKHKRANFIKNISLLFTDYANNKQLLTLGYEELSIAEGIYNISKQRNEAGTISRGVTLQAQVDYEMVKIRIQTLELRAVNSYYTLLKSAGISDEIDLDFKYTFSLLKDTDTQNNPDLNFIQSKQKKALAQAQVNSNSIEWVSVVAEYEAEQNQDILRVGAFMPLAFFNSKSQEKRISQLEASKAELLANNKKLQLSIEISKLKKQRELLASIRFQNKKTLKTQTKLLNMFEDGYKIASINLLQLQTIKNNLIQTKENIIKLNTALNQNAINTNYLTGVYND